MYVFAKRHHFPDFTAAAAVAFAVVAAVAVAVVAAVEWQGQRPPLWLWQ